MSTKKKMERSKPMKTNKAYNGLYSATDGNQDDKTTGAAWLNLVIF
jgi:hypothetical protein